MRKAVFFVALLAMVLPGCAGKMDAQRGLSEEWRLRSLEENFLNFKENQREMEERGRDSQRKLLERVRALEETVASMQEGGRVATAPVKRTEPLTSAPAAPEEKTAVPAPAVAEALAEAAHAPAKHAAPAHEPVPPTGKSLYDQGMTLVRQEKSEEGRKLLTEFMQTDPKSALTPNAIYWMGESYFVDKNYAQAILTFKDVTRRFPKHHKAAAALLKIAMCYQQMGEKDNATLYLRALLREHPKSEPAPAARKMLAELGG
jgi:tol-pal system protein YbgF